MNLKCEIQVSDSEIIKDILLITHMPKVGEKFNLPGNAVVINTTIPGSGMDISTIISFIVENVESISSGIFAAYLYDKIKNELISIRIGNRQKKIKNKEDIEKMIDSEREEIKQDDDTEV